MGHTQLKTGVQGGHVEHRGETEVKVVQKDMYGPFFQPYQEDSEGLASNHMYLKKGSIWTQEVDLCNI